MYKQLLKTVTNSKPYIAVYVVTEYSVLLCCSANQLVIRR